MPIGIILFLTKQRFNNLQSQFRIWMRTLHNHDTKGIMRQKVWFRSTKGMVLQGETYPFALQNHTYRIPALPMLHFFIIQAGCLPQLVLHIKHRTAG